ncbi:hypothetical protein AQUCO_06600057v1 [Aquilegia coerulea]|uniref:Uncharacterized protein n=1 Tax=Aquilegia coerulea TaxID=218851 RepID=A0A2G5CC83_AQUCA|nr:hypothetical protein AQUCO_06600057v1 [Aquilegia coerulea]
MDEVITVADASSFFRSNEYQPSILPSNLPLLSALFAFFVAQFLKLIFGSGGIPSSHLATVSALAVAISFQHGIQTSSFSIAVVLALVVMYDASGVRLHAGRQAELLNQIVCELPPEHPSSNVRPLHELLWHTLLQVVAGAILGCVISYLMRNSQ